MDNEMNTEEESTNDENDEVDGSLISRLRRRRRGVRVTGKYIPPLAWERIHASHSVSSLNNSYFERINDDMEKNFQAPDMSTKLLLKDEKQSSNQKDHRVDDASNAEEVKQRNESVESTQAAVTKDGQNVLQVKVKDKSPSIRSALERSNEGMLPIGSAVHKETMEELKSTLKESQLIHCKNKWIPTHGATHVHIPKCSENVKDKSGLTFETFRPYLAKENLKPELINQPESKQSQEMLVDQILPVPGEPKIEAQTVQSIEMFDGRQPLMPEKLNVTSGIKLEPSLVELEDQKHHGSKSIYQSTSGIQSPFHLTPQIERIKQQIAREDIRFVRFEASDLHGVSRSKTIPARFFQEKAINGIYMPRSYLELTLNPKDSEVDRISTAHFNSDIILKPDLQTFRVLPWTDKIGRVICDSFTFSKDPLLTSPRYLAKRLLSQLQESGFQLHAAFTYEFCIFGVAEIINSKTISFPAATLLTDHDQVFMQELFDGMYYIGGNIGSFSSSSGPGQMEISFQPEFGLSAADNAFTFRTGVKEVAKKHGCIASFYTDLEGFYNSGPLSHSLWDVNGANNLFCNGSQKKELTNIAKNWLSGLLLHSASLSCLVSPGVACRKNFAKDVKDSQDSISATWGANDNSCTFNIKPHGCTRTYIENKLCSATANPYLVLAATIAAGLDGIRRGLNLMEGLDSSHNVSELKVSVPLKLEDALSALLEDKCIRESLGEPFIQYFVAMKQYELETEETDSERNKFLEYFI